MEGSHTGLDVLAEGDLTAGVAVPGPFPDLGVLPVRGAFGGPERGIGAGGALPCLGVAVAGDEPFVADVGDAESDPGHEPAHSVRNCPVVPSPGVPAASRHHRRRVFRPFCGDEAWRILE